MEKIDGYRVIRELGEQRKRKFGITYLVEDEQSFQKAIIKLFIKTSKNVHLFEQIKKESTYHFEKKEWVNVIFMGTNQKALQF